MIDKAILHPIETFPKSVKVIAPLIIEMLEPKSVVDFGCGTGYWLDEFKRLGVNDIFGIDGAYVLEAGPLIPNFNFLPFDLERICELDLGRHFDVALCLECAEHLDAEVAPKLIETICRYATHVVFSAALPGQTGWGHKNEQYPDYWQRLFANNGFQMFDFFRPRIWKNEIIAFWYRQNMYLFSKSPELFKGQTSAWDGTIYISHDLLELYVQACNSRNAGKDFLFGNLGPVSGNDYGRAWQKLRHIASKSRRNISKLLRGQY